MKIPTTKECYKLLEIRGAVPNNVIRHSEQVCKISVYLGRKFISNGIKVNIDLLRTSSLLHDIAKSIDFTDFKPQSREDDVTEEQKKKWVEIKEIFPEGKHSEAGSKMLSDYPEIAKIVLAHRLFQANKGFESDEEKIVYYADKLVKHDKITFLQARLDDLHVRYGQTKDKERHTIELEKNICILESEILNKAGVTSEELIELDNKSIKEFLS